MYWPNQSEDVAKYIAGCIECARHGPALRSQPLHPVHVIHPMQLLGMDWVGPLPVTKSGMAYIFHVICYFSRFSFTFASPTANSADVIRFLGILFVRYHKPLAIYCDRGQHFDSEETKTYLRDEGVNLSFSASGSSKSTGMVEVGNCLLQEVLKKSAPGEWDEKLAPATQQVNARVIQHLQVAPSAIFFGAQATVGSLDSELAFIPTSSVDAWVEEVTNPVTHFAAVRKYRDYRA